MERGSTGLKPSQLIAISLGNALAFYDFLVFGIFAVQIGQAIFPQGDSANQLLLTLGTFGTGFVTRPIGAWVIGRLGDIRGRKPAMLLSFSLVGIAMLVQALVPPYAAIGIWAPIIMLLCRLVLGFGLGGEVGPCTAYLAEAAPLNKRGFYVSLQYVTQDSSYLIAGGVGVALSSLMSDAALATWGWRIAMLIGLLIIPFGMYVRSRLEETSYRNDPEVGTSRTGLSARTIAIFGFFVIASGAVGSYGTAYVNVYAQTVLHMPTQEAFGATLVYGLAAVAFDFIAGTASDRVGRKPIMIGGALIMVLSLIPCFMWLNAHPTLLVLSAVTFWLSTWNALWPAAALVTLTEALPALTRSATLAVTYALALVIFGGTTQFLLAWLTQLTGDPLAPAYYILAMTVVGIVAMLRFPETAPARQRGLTRAAATGA